MVLARVLAVCCGYTATITVSSQHTATDKATVAAYLNVVLSSISRKLAGAEVIYAIAILVVRKPIKCQSHASKQVQ